MDVLSEKWLLGWILLQLLSWNLTNKETFSSLTCNELYGILPFRHWMPLALSGVYNQPSLCITKGRKTHSTLAYF